MPDEPTQDQDTALEIEQAAVVGPEPTVAEEARSGKKSKAVKKKATAESLPEEEQALEPIAPPASEPVATTEKVEQANPVVAEPIAPPASEPVATTEKVEQVNRNDDLFQQGIQSLLRCEYDAADNFFGQALTVYRQNGNQAGQIDVLEQRGHLCYLRGAEAQAHEYYRQVGLMRNA